MSKIYEALENAQKESRELTTAKTELPQTTHASVLRSDTRMDFENEMIALYQNIETRLPDLERKVILFLSAKEGEGTSTIVREFARIAARKMGKTVFLMDSRRNSHQKCIFLHIIPEDTREGLATGSDACRNEMDLEMCPIEKYHDNAPLNFYSPNIADFWDSLRQKYDLVLIDSSSASSSPDGIEISRRVDGVVLVVEAEKTRWQVVENLKEKIENSGGNILGMVFNKRRFYIPENIYRRL
ncbi:MAG: CpsD/CapB family tyrosine-protein kinase [Geobacteraceae bacterium]|nr:CpsD/CapB family tyrosine-protein kinase [Geobacteraceae bacterium]